MRFNECTTLRRMLQELKDYRFALDNLVLKDFRIRYRNMSLGILWSVVNPLVMLSVLVFIFMYVYPQQKMPYFPIFVLLGLIGYNFFNLSMASATNSILENSNLIKKVIFPRIFIPLSVVLSQLIHFAIQLMLLAVFILIFRVPLTWSYAWLPLIYLVELLFIMGLCFITSALNVFYHDVYYLVMSSLTLLFWFTPIFYPLSKVHESLPKAAYGLYILNPLAGCIDASRNAVIFNTNPDAVAFGFACAIALITFFGGIKFFNRYQRYFADRV